MTGLRGKPGVPIWSVLYKLAKFGGPQDLCLPLLPSMLSLYLLLQCVLPPHPGTPPHLPPRECPPVPVAEPTASLRSPAIGNIVSQVIQLELLGETGRG